VLAGVLARWVFLDGRSVTGQSPSNHQDCIDIVEIRVNTLSRRLLVQFGHRLSFTVPCILKSQWHPTTPQMEDSLQHDPLLYGITNRVASAYLLCDCI